MPIKVVAITGSLRTASVNAGLLRAAAALAPKHDMEFIIVSADLPLYNGDLEEAGAAGDAHAVQLASMRLGRRSCSHNSYFQQAYPSPSKLCAPNLPQLTLYFSASKNSTTLCQVIADYLQCSTCQCAYLRSRGSSCTTCHHAAVTQANACCRSSQERHRLGQPLLRRF
jgi:hypothetical protein